MIKSHGESLLDALKHPSVGNTGPYTTLRDVLYICCILSFFFALLLVLMSQVDNNHI